MSNNVNLERIALLYRDLLSSKVKSLSQKDKDLLLSLQPKNKIVAIGDIDLSNWNAYPLTYLLSKKLVAPTVLDESKVYQSIHAMRTHNTSVLHPQMLVSQSVIIRIVGFDNSANINDYINSFINMCIASDECKIIFVIVDGDKRFYKNKIHTRKANSTFIDNGTGEPYKIESTPLIISPDDITFFNYSKLGKSINPKSSSVAVSSTVSSRKKSNLSSLSLDSDFI